METMPRVRGALRRDGWVASADMTDGYFHILLNKQFHRFFRLCLGGGVMYQF